MKNVLNMELISIIVPVYNAERYLDRCISSLLNQTYKNIEVLLIDDGSSDSSGKMCDNWGEKDNRIRVFHQSNQGPSAARNLGLKMAGGGWFAFADADDYMASDMIETLYTVATSTRTKIAICGYYNVNEEHLFENTYGKDGIITPSIFFESILEGVSIGSAVWNKIFRYDLFDEIRFPEGKLYEDVSICYKLISLCDEMAIVKDCLYYYCMNEQSIVHAVRETTIQNFIEALEERLLFIEKNYPEMAARADLKLLEQKISGWNQLARNNYLGRSTYMDYLRADIKKGKSSLKQLNRKYRVLGNLIVYCPQICATVTRHVSIH